MDVEAVYRNRARVLVRNHGSCFDIKCVGCPFRRADGACYSSSAFEKARAYLNLASEEEEEPIVL